jgi:hypothetical protein
MWCPEGYLTIYEIWNQFMWDSDLIPVAADRSEIDEAQRYTRLESFEYRAYETWIMNGLFCVFEADIRACLASGSIVRIGSLPKVIDRLDGDRAPENKRFPFGGFPDAYEARREISTMNHRYVGIRNGCTIIDVHETLPELDPIIGAPLCIQESRLPVRLEDLSHWLIEKLDDTAKYSKLRGSLDRANISTQIVMAFESEKVKTKTDAKRMFGQDMKHEHWLALWREAVALNPALARPGPR